VFFSTSKLKIHCHLQTYIFSSKASQTIAVFINETQPKRTNSHVHVHQQHVFIILLVPGHVVE